MTDIYKKSILIALLLLVTVHSEEISTTKNIENTDFSNIRLTTDLPYLSPYDDELVTKENPKRLLHLLMPLSQNEHEKPKKASRRTKRCNSFRKERLLSSTKKNLTKTRATSLDKNNIGISKQNSNINSFKNVNYSQRNFATSDRIQKTEMQKDKFLRAFKDNAEDESINSESEEMTKKRSTEKCICYCKENNCFPESSKKSSSQILGSSRKNKLGRTNNRLREKYGNARPDISQQKSLRSYHERPYETRVPGPINFFPIQSYQERVIVPHVPVLYGIEAKPYVLSHMAGNERKFGIPFTSSHGRPNFLVGSNAHNQYRPIVYRDPCLLNKKNQIVDPIMSATSSSVDAAVAETESDPESYDLITEQDEESFLTLTTETWDDYIDTSTELNTESNIYRDHSDVTTESSNVNFSNSNEMEHKLKESEETTKRNQDDNLSVLTSSLTDYVDTSSIPITYPSITYNGKLISMTECIKLFGRDVCVLSTTTGMYNDLKKYSMTPEYIAQTSMKGETTRSNINYSDKLGTTDAYSSLRSSLNEIEKSNANLENNFESASREPNVNEDEQTYESDDDNEQNKSSNSVENTHIPLKKLMNQEVSELTETAKNKVLGKSKSNKFLLTLNDKNTANPISGEKFPHSTTSSEFSSDKEIYNLKINQNNLITTTSADLSQNISNKEESLEEKILQEPPQAESTTSHDFKIKSSFEEESASGFNESNDNAYLEPTILREQPTQKTIVSPNLVTEYNFEETKESFVESQTDTYSEKILREPSTTVQCFNHKKSNNLNNDEVTTDNLEAIIHSPRRKLPFCDNSLLFNAIRKVINDFASNAPLGKTKNLDENILQTQGKNLLPEILQVSDLRNILSIPRIENAIVEMVKNILSDITAIPKRDFTNDWSHGIIRNTLQNILENFADFHRKLPPMTVEEHQFVNGQWMINPVTLASIRDGEVSITNPQNLRESIRDLLSFPAIASQVDQQIVRNMIVQSIKNNLINDDEEEKIDNSIIDNVLDDVLQAIKNSKNTDESRKFVNNKDIISSQKTSIDDSEIGINISNSTLSNERDLDINIDKKVDNKEKTTTQKAEVLENNPNQLIVSTSSDLLKSSEENKNIYIEEKTPNEIIDKIKENIRDQISDGIKKINMQNDKEIIDKPLKTNTAYQKAILPNNHMLAIPAEPDLAEELNKTENAKNMLLQTTTVSSVTSKNFYETEENIMNSTPIMQTINMQNKEEIKNYPDTWNHIIVQQPTSNPNFAKESSDEFNANLNSKEDSPKYDEIEPPITDEKNNNKLPVNSYPSNDRIVDESVKVTTSTDFMQETFRDDAEMPDGIISKNIAEAKDVKDQTEVTFLINEETLTTSANNLISSTNKEYENQESNTAATVSVDTVHPLIILERIRNKEPPIKYYSPEGLQLIESNPNDESVKIASTDFVQEPLPDYVQMSNGVVLQNAAENKDIEGEVESDEKASLTPSDNVILPTNAEYKNCESKITPSADKNILILQQQNFATDDNIVKIHEVTTEVQRTYAKTTYFKTQPSTDDSSRITSSLLEYEITKKTNNDNNVSIDKNKSSTNENINLLDNNYNSTTAEGNEVIASSFQSSSNNTSSNNTYYLQLFPSSTAFDSISELQKSQLYYINDGVKLPLEIKKLEDGSYALLIFKNICEQIMKKECPCCVPLQGHVIQESRKAHNKEDKNMIATTTERQYQEDIHINNHKRNNQFANSSPTLIMTTNKNTLMMQPDEKEESINRFQKRNLNYNDLTTISMPVIEFAKKYNLLLNKDKVLLDEIESNKNQNYASLSLTSAKNDETKWDKFEEEKKATQRIDSTNKERNPILKEIMISGEEIEMESKKMNWDKLANIEKENVRVSHNKKKREHKETEFVNDKHNIPQINIYDKNNGRPYRYQRNANNVRTNPITELIKSILYWIKDFFVNKKS